MRWHLPSIRTSILVASAVLVVAFAAPTLAQAQQRNAFDRAAGELGTVAVRAGQEAGTQEGALEMTVGRIIRGALSLAGVVFFGFIVWGGYLWMTAAGEEAKITRAKKMISGAIIGLAITLAAYALTIFVIEKVTTAAGFGAAPGGDAPPAAGG